VTARKRTTPTKTKPAKATAKTPATRAARKGAAGPASKRSTTKTAQKGAKKATKTIPKVASSAKTKTTPLTEYNRKRDFKKTREPAGKVAARTGKLRFVVQKHDASHLHFDLRLELDGVMKSWAVPKGPSADPSVKRLAMQVEDHPISYNSFEGTIPAGEYGGGTVMLWDTGTYTPEFSTGPADDESAAQAAYDKGDFKVTFHGHRLKGSYVLVRTKGFGSRSASKPSWLLIKHRDDYALTGKKDLVERYTTSVTTDRSMDEITEAG